MPSAAAKPYTARSMPWPYALALMTARVDGSCSAAGYFEVVAHRSEVDARVDRTGHVDEVGRN
jgi:hypothetical protein